MSQVWRYMILTPELRRQNKDYYSKFKDSLAYTVNTRLTGAV